MLVSFAVIGGLAAAEKFDHSVFWFETLVIILFAAFWVTQTFELWKQADDRAARPLPRRLPVVEGAPDREPVRGHGRLQT